LPRTGSTVWLESECILHHYKFYLAIENSRDVDYVTEKLYQGLRAGAVPIYWGAPNVRMYLPHPSAALFFDDFPNVSALIDYVKRASADEVLYEQHMRWKAAPLSNDFMQRVVQRPVDGIFCQVCDAVARGLASHTLGPIVGGKGGEPIVLPPCILEALRGSTSSIVRNWAKLAGGKSSHVPTYVLSIASAHKRHEFMRNQLQSAELSADFVGAFDASTMSNSSFDCLNPRSPLDGRPLQEHPYSIPGPRVISVTSAHFATAWDVFSKGLEYALVLEDDALLLSSFTPSIARALVEAPATWHMIFLGGCADLHVPAADASKLLWPRREARCAHAYLLSYEGARLMLDSLPMRWTIDFHINMAAVSGSWEVFWAEPPSALQSKDFVSLLEAERSRQGVT
jgi:GR25 family glycosyltransferase involved in LPS biosynthesis